MAEGSELGGRQSQDDIAVNFGGQLRRRQLRRSSPAANSGGQLGTMAAKSGGQLGTTWDRAEARFSDLEARARKGVTTRGRGKHATVWRSSLAADSGGHVWRSTPPIKDALLPSVRTNTTRVAEDLTAGVDQLTAGVYHHSNIQSIEPHHHL